jgi:hypothetical protein
MVFPVASRQPLNGVADRSFVYLKSKCAGHCDRDGSSFVFADGFATAGPDLYFGGESGAVAGQGVMISGMIEQPKRIREFRERPESPSGNPSAAGLDEAIRCHFPPKYLGSQLFGQPVIVHSRSIDMGTGPPPAPSLPMTPGRGEKPELQFLIGFWSFVPKSSSFGYGEVGGVPCKSLSRNTLQGEISPSAE